MRPVNLIPQDQRRRTPREGSGKGAHLLLGVLAVLLAMAVVYVLTANTVTERQNQTEEARLEADRLEAKAADKLNFTDFAQVAQRRIASVASVASTRFDWERFMRELALVLPERGWLVSADASVTGASADPAAVAAPTTGAAGSPTANLVGCTPDHPDVALMMVRLRQLHRVTDVQLNQSSKEDAATEATLESCGANAGFDLTVTFSPTAPAAEAPIGATRVPASLGGGS
jgi:Tfp pilus assembly protein PilN